MGTTAILKDKEQIEFNHTQVLQDDNKMLIKTKFLGVCTSDIKNYLANNSHYFGHEMVGEVVYDFEKFKRGDYVNIFHKHGCMDCIGCNSGFLHLCQSPHLMPMSFAEYVSIPKKSVEYCVYKLPKSDNYGDYVFLDSLSCVVRGVNRLNLTSGKKVLINGTGFLAILYASILMAKNFTVHLFGGNQKKAELINKKLPNYIVKTSISELDKYDIQIDTTGNAELLSELVNFIVPQGQLLCFSSFNHPLSLGYFRNNEITLLFSKHTTRSDVTEAIDLISSKTIPMKEMFTFYRHLDDLENSIKSTIENKIIRGVICLD
ncbi:alcohol dehydrogenase catalytic domain-containing protein [Paenibacillus roseus]